jgi:hypothetical protein
MKTRSSDEQIRHGLPPPPAPTASDANPWQMSSPPAGSKPEPRHPRAPGWPPAHRTPEQRARRRARSLPWIPLMILFAVAGTGVQTAIRALWEGDVETAIGALVIFAVVAVVALRRILKTKE